MNNRQIEKFRKMLRHIQRELMELFRNDAQCCGISTAQCHAMIELGNSGKTAISTLAGELGLDKSTLSRTIDSLVRQGLVLRNTNDDDRRFMTIELSASGMNFNKLLNEKYNRIFREALEDIPEEDQSKLLEAMELFITVLSRIK